MEGAVLALVSSPGEIDVKIDILLAYAAEAAKASRVFFVIPRLYKFIGESLKCFGRFRVGARLLIFFC